MAIEDREKHEDGRGESSPNRGELHRDNGVSTRIQRLLKYGVKMTILDSNWRLLWAWISSFPALRFKGKVDANTYARGFLVYFLAHYLVSFSENG
jgi:hypothetical protein